MAAHAGESAVDAAKRIVVQLNNSVLAIQGPPGAGKTFTGNVTWRQEVGATPIEAQKAAGHASLDMTFLYTQTDDGRERAQVSRILDRLKPVANDQPAEVLAKMASAGGVQ